MSDADRPDDLDDKQEQPSQPEEVNDSAATAQEPRAQEQVTDDSVVPQIETVTDQPQNNVPPVAASAAATSEQPSPKQKKNWVAGLALFLAIISIAVLIAAGVFVNGQLPNWQTVSQQRGERIAALEQQASSVAEVNSRQDNEVQSLRASQGELASREQMADFQSRLQRDQKQYQNAVDGTLAELTRLVKGGRVTWQLGEVEHLLLVANDRVQLAADANGAIQALKLANERLSAINDPRFLRVRDKIVREITALRAIEQPDTVNMVLTLSSIVRSVPQLPIPTDVPASYEPNEALRPAVSEAREGWERIKQAMKSSLHDYVVIRRKDEPLEPLMAPDQSFFLRQNLVLKLETARLALLQQDGKTFRDSITLSREWLARWFDLKQPAVASARQQLEALERAKISVALPEISGSLVLFRERLADIEMAAKQ